MSSSFPYNHEQNQQLKTCRHLPKTELKKLGKLQVAAITQTITEVAPAGFAEQRGKAFRIEAKHSPRLSPTIKRWTTVGTAIVGSIICSASVQSVTLPLPRQLRTVATPVIAGTLTLGSEILARKALTQLRLKKRHHLAEQQIIQGVDLDEEESSFNGQHYPLDIEWRKAELKLLDKIEAKPWPVMEGSILGGIFLAEAGSALWWVMNESFIAAVFAASIPPVYVLLIALLLAPQEEYEALETLADIYDEYLPPQTFSSDLTTVAAPSLYMPEANTGSQMNTSLNGSAAINPEAPQS